MNRSIYVIYAPLMKGFFVTDEVIEEYIISCVYGADFSKAWISADKSYAVELAKELDTQLPDIKHHVLTVKCKL